MGFKLKVICSKYKMTISRFVFSSFVCIEMPEFDSFQIKMCKYWNYINMTDCSCGTKLTAKFGTLCEDEV